MNIWDWLVRRQTALAAAGHDRLAHLADVVPEAVVDDEHDHADLMIAEGIALSRALRDDWLELYFRHWSLQSRVMHRMEGKRALPDAVALVDFAHAQGRAECPQSVCTVQDLAACYGFVDGPGFAAERKQVAEETLAKIDPTWGCFTCISSEYASALIDERRHADALAFLQRQEELLLAHGRGTDHAFVEHRVEALVSLGRLDEAARLIDAAEGDPEADDDHHAASERSLQRARIASLRGDGKTALRVLSSVRRLDDTPLFYRHFITIAARLVAMQSLPNDAALGARIERYLERLEAQGVVRTTFDLSAVAAELAADRDDQRGLDAARSRARRLAGELRGDHGARATLDAMDGLDANRKTDEGPRR